MYESLGMELTNTVYALEFHDHRSVPVAISMGSLSLHQGGGEDAHVARSARQHPELRSHLEPQAARRSCLRFADPRSRRHLRHGSRLHRLRAPLRLASGWRFFVTRAKSNWMRTASTRRRRIGRPVSLPTRLSHWMAILPARTIPFICAASNLRMPHRKKAGVSDQPFHPAGDIDPRRIQEPLAGRTVFQMDKAASSDQAVLRHVGQRGEDTNMDCGFRYVWLPSSRSASARRPRSTLCSRFSRSPSSRKCR